MNYKFWIFCLMALFGVFSVHGACDSFFQEGGDTCLRVENTPFTFSITGVDEEKVTAFNASMYEKSLPANRMQLETEGLQASTVQPPSGPGIYVLEMKLTLDSGQTVTTDKEFIYDPSRPLPPSVPIMRRSESTEVTFAGEAVPGSTITVQRNDGSTSSVSADDSGSFSFDLTLDRGTQHLRFYTERNGKTSDIVHRVVDVAPDGRERNAGASVTGIGFADLAEKNERVSMDGGYVTTQRAFYVGGSLDGSDLEGAPVAINSRETLADSDGDFGGMVLLNEGSNTITVQSGGRTETLSVTYLRPETFTVQSLDVANLVKSSPVTIEGETNHAMPMQLWRNGEPVRQFETSGGSFAEDVGGLKPGRNTIRLELPNDQSITRSVYYDHEAPTITLASSPKIGEDGMVVFRMSDDTGVDRSSLEFTIGEETYTMTSVEKVVGNYYRFDLGELPAGSHNYDITVEDRLGTTASASGTIEKANGVTALPDVSIPDGEQLGNHLFVREGENTLIFDPTRFVAFDGIYLDGTQIVDYEIKRSGNVEVQASFSNTTGTMTLAYENTDGERYTQEFIYHTDREGPRLTFHQVDRVATPVGERVRVSGRISDEFFDWDSLAFNANSSYQRYGQYFEALVQVEQEGLANLEIIGNDIVGQGFENGFLGGMIRGDGNDLSIQYDRQAGPELPGTMQNLGVHPFAKLSAIDGNEHLNGLAPGSFTFPLTQLEGTRNVELRGEERSGRNFHHESSFSVDGTRPEIEFRELSGKTRIRIDGTFSAVDNVTIRKDGSSVSRGGCNAVDVGAQQRCFEVFTAAGEELQVEAKDAAGHTASANYTAQGTPSSQPSEDPYLSFSFQNNLRQTVNAEASIEGIIDTNLVVENVTINGRDDCTFTDSSFLCDTGILDEGENSFDIVVTSNESLSVNKSYTITRLGSGTLDVALLELLGSDIFKIRDSYYTSVYNFTLKGNVSETATITLLKNNFETVIGEQDGEFTYEVSIEDAISGKTRETVELQLQAQKESQEEQSNIISVIFSQFPEPLAQVFVG